MASLSAVLNAHCIGPEAPITAHLAAGKPQAAGATAFREPSVFVHPLKLPRAVAGTAILVSVSIVVHGTAMLRPIHCLLALSLAALMLAGCGNKGDLVLPDQQPKKQKKSQPATPTKAPAAKPADSGSSGGGADPVH